MSSANIGEAHHPLLHGLVAGALATGALEAAAPLERAVAGGALPFRPAAIARALGRLAGVNATPAAGELMQWTYGPGWAVAYAALRRRLPLGHVARAAALAGAIFAVELATLPPLLGRRRLLRPRVLGALGLHIALFATVVEGVLSAFDRARSPAGGGLRSRAGGRS